MNLHTNKEVFYTLVTLTAKHFRITPTFVEKDYWITLILHNLSNSPFSNNVVFKGGTSLSKGYRLVNRLSEDIAMIEKLVSLIRFSFSENPTQAITSKIRHFHDLHYLAQDSECWKYVQCSSQVDFAFKYLACESNYCKY